MFWGQCVLSRSDGFAVRSVLLVGGAKRRVLCIIIRECELL